RYALAGMRVRVVFGLLLLASCTKSAMDDSPTAPTTQPAADAGPPDVAEASITVADASDAGSSKAVSCASLPAYVCDFSIGSCVPFDAIGAGANGTPSFPDDGG